MFSAKSIVAALAVLAAVPSALATLSITTPSSTNYWVFATSNQIVWAAPAAGDPTTVSITVTNSDNNLLNGVFSIAQNVPVSILTYTVTDVTLKPGTGYVVNFLNGTNSTQIYTSSAPFEVKAAGTLPFDETVYTTLSVSGSVTLTLTETSTSGVPQATGSTGNSTVTSTAASTTTVGTSASTATIIQKGSSSSGAMSFKNVGNTAAGVVGALVVAFLVL